MSTVRMFPSLVRIGLLDAIAYRGEMLVWLLSTNTPLIMLMLWTAVAREAPIGRYGSNEFVAYFLVTLIMRLLTGGWVAWQINMEVRGGQLSQRLLRPLHPFVAYAAESLGAWPLRLVLCLPVAIGAVMWVGPGEFADSAGMWLLLPFAVFGAWALNFFAMAAMGTIALYKQSALGVFEFWLGLYFVMSGYIVPLDLFPPAVRLAADLLPFRYILSLPVEVTLGSGSLSELTRLVAIQWACAGFFLVLSLVLWRRGLKRFEAFGG